jgi:hypothetical protein
MTSRTPQTIIGSNERFRFNRERDTQPYCSFFIFLLMAGGRMRTHSSRPVSRCLHHLLKPLILEKSTNNQQLLYRKR